MDIDHPDARVLGGNPLKNLGRSELAGLIGDVIRESRQMRRTGADIDEHGILGRYNAQESASHKVGAEDVDLERLPPLRRLGLGQGEEFRHEACVGDEDTDVTYGLKGSVDGLLVRDVCDESGDFGLWERGSDRFLGGQGRLFGAPRNGDRSCAGHSKATCDLDADSGAAAWDRYCGSATDMLQELDRSTVRVFEGGKGQQRIMRLRACAEYYFASGGKRGFGGIDGGVR